MPIDPNMMLRDKKDSAELERLNVILAKVDAMPWPDWKKSQVKSKVNLQKRQLSYQTKARQVGEMEQELAKFGGNMGMGGR